MNDKYTRTVSNKDASCFDLWFSFFRLTRVHQSPVEILLQIEKLGNPFRNIV